MYAGPYMAITFYSTELKLLQISLILKFICEIRRPLQKHVDHKFWFQVKPYLLVRVEIVSFQETLDLLFSNFKFKGEH